MRNADSHWSSGQTEGWDQTKAWAEGAAGIISVADSGLEVGCYTRALVTAAELACARRASLDRASCTAVASAWLSAAAFAAASSCFICMTPAIFGAVSFEMDKACRLCDGD